MVFLGRGGGVGGAGGSHSGPGAVCSSSVSVSLVSDTQIFGKRQQSAHLSKVHWRITGFNFSLRSELRAHLLQRHPQPAQDLHGRLQKCLRAPSEAFLERGLRGKTAARRGTGVV